MTFYIYTREIAPGGGLHRPYLVQTAPGEGFHGHPKGEILHFGTSTNANSSMSFLLDNPQNIPSPFLLLTVPKRKPF